MEAMKVAVSEYCVNAAGCITACMILGEAENVLHDGK
jgi:hypothetical protein